MANTSPEHKTKKSQKRKDRQERKRKREIRRMSENLKIEEKPKEKEKNGESPEKNEGKVKQEAEKRRKSLPGYLAKNADVICAWLRNYCYLFMKADDANIGFLDGIPRERRDFLVQEYVDVRNFIENVRILKTPDRDVSTPEANLEES